MLCPVQEGVRGDVQGQDGNLGRIFGANPWTSSSGKLLHVDS